MTKFKDLFESQEITVGLVFKNSRGREYEVISVNKKSNRTMSIEVGTDEELFIPYKDLMKAWKNEPEKFDISHAL